MKNTGAWTVALLLVAGAAAGCFRNTVSEMELDIPAMTSPAAAARVEAGLKTLGDAVKGIDVDVEHRRVVVKFDNVRLGRRNVEVAVAHAGFAVNDWPADEEARAKLPEEMQGHE
ncbi:MAG: heavy-metal-associated domain-containing protein [Kiritimatiellae bacterium]|nr:heavy-metal-associated domain-containing protein [Kiritimatiellia bacterium]